MVTDNLLSERLSRVRDLTGPGAKFETEAVVVRGAERRSYVTRPANLVEHALESHPDVIEVAVIGVPHPDLGEEVKAVVVVHNELDLHEIEEYGRQRLAKFKVPTEWDIRTEPLARNAAGKIRKPDLRGD